jgi:hypothetical protein
VPICTAAAPSAKAAASPIGDGARGDDWHFHRIDNLRQQCEQTGLRLDVVVEKHAAMATGLATLRNHGVDAPRGEPARFGDCGC